MYLEVDCLGEFIYAENPDIFLFLFFDAPLETPNTSCRVESYGFIAVRFKNLTVKTMAATRKTKQLLLKEGTKWSNVLLLEGMEKPCKKKKHPALAPAF